MSPSTIFAIEQSLYYGLGALQEAGLFGEKAKENVEEMGGAWNFAESRSLTGIAVRTAADVFSFVTEPSWDNAKSVIDPWDTDRYKEWAAEEETISSTEESEEKETATV